jgi:hypothetical protein
MHPRIAASDSTNYSDVIKHRSEARLARQPERTGASKSSEHVAYMRFASDYRLSTWL